MFKILNYSKILTNLNINFVYSGSTISSGAGAGVEPPELDPPELEPPELDPPELEPPELDPPELLPPELELEEELELEPEPGFLLSEGPEV